MRIKLRINEDQRYRINTEESPVGSVFITECTLPDNASCFTIISDGNHVCHLSADFHSREKAREAWRDGFEVRRTLPEPHRAAVVDALIASGLATRLG